MNYISCLILLVLTAGASGQVLNRDLPNDFSYTSVVPYGCLTVIPSVTAPPEELYFDQEVLVSDAGLSALIRLRAWRTGCHEPNSSAVMLNIDHLSGSPSIRYPRVSLVSRNGIGHAAGLFYFSRLNYYDPSGASMKPMTDQVLATLVEGVSFVVDTDAATMSKQQYNGELELRLDWLTGQKTSIPVAAHDDQLESPQFANAVLHGRYSGQWIVDGLPRQGLILQIAELPPDRNILLLNLFTYLDRSPTWVVGNAEFPAGSDSVTVNMWTLEGGEFFTSPLNSYDGDEVTQDRLGTMTIRPRHCHVIDADIDFSESGLGVVALRFERLVRIAGYDCDQTR